MATSSQTTTRPTRSSARTAAESTTPKRRKVEHFYWIEDGRVAFELQVEVRAICGVWMGHIWAYPKDSITVDNTGIQVDDCRRCLAVLDAHHRRNGASPIR